MPVIGSPCGCCRTEQLVCHIRAHPRECTFAFDAPTCGLPAPGWCDARKGCCFPERGCWRQSASIAAGSDVPTNQWETTMQPRIIALTVLAAGLMAGCGLAETATTG